MLRYTRFKSEKRSTLCGFPFTVLREEPEMPRIADVFLDCSIYLYRSEADATQRQRAGGTGFVVGIPAAGDGWLARGKCPDDRLCHTYAVSNRHVVQGHSPLKPSAPVIRLNKHDGKYDVIPFKLEDWTCSDEHDLAVTPIDPSRHKCIFINTDMAVTHSTMAECDIGLGDEVFMVGRFVNHEGEQRNIPAMRWGHIAMMPYEPVYHPSNESGRQESFLVEIHTIPGYSGSPVFVRPFPVQKLDVQLPTGDAPPSMSYKSLGHGPWLLGVEWGAINTHNQDLNSGMSGVVPTWHLLDLLNMEKFKEQRRQEQEEIIQRHEQGGTTLT